MTASHPSLLCCALTAVFLALPAVAPGGDGTLEVSVTVDGEQVVDARRPVFVMLFGGPGMGAPGSPLLAVGRVTSNGGTTSFDGLPETVWVAAIYDPSGTFTGLSGVIPGSLAGGYAEEGATQAAPVATGETAAVDVKLDESTRLPGDPDKRRSAVLEAAANGIVEIRTYTIRDGMREAFVEFFEQKTLEHQARTGLKVVGQFRSLEDENTFVWIRTFESEQQRIEQLRDYYLGPDWMAVQDEGMALIADTKVALMEPTELSSWR